MRLVIHARALHQSPLSQAVVGEFDERGGTIGRSDSNTLTLPDPERHVSRLQAQISFADGGFAIRNVGSANAIVVNGKLLNPGEAVPLAGNDRMTIGGFDLQSTVGVDGSTSASELRPVDARRVIGASAGEGRTHPPTGRSTMPGNAIDDPFADLLGPAQASTPVPLPAASPPAAPAAPRHPMPPSGQGVPARLPDDFDPFAPPSTFGPDDPANLPSIESMVGDRRAAPGALDALFGLDATTAGGTHDPVHDFLRSAPASPRTSPAAKPTLVPRAPTSVDDPFAFLQPDHGDSIAPPVADHEPLLRGAYQPPRLNEPRQVAPAPAAASTAGAQAELQHQLWAALCEGAGVPAGSPSQLTPALMRAVGASLREAIDGAVHLSAVRTTAKQEMRVPVTVIQVRDNNPLKFAPDARTAVTMLLQPPATGFLSGPEAVRDMMTDLLGHAAGTVAGMRAAINGMLERFEPAQLEAQLARGGMLDTLLQGNRRARLWELYLQQYSRISEGARDDFHALFGQAFAKAYEHQSARMAAARRSAP